MKKIIFMVLALGTLLKGQAQVWTVNLQDPSPDFTALLTGGNILTWYGANGSGQVSYSTAFSPVLDPSSGQYQIVFTLPGTDDSTGDPFVYDSGLTFFGDNSGFGVSDANATFSFPDSPAGGNFNFNLASGTLTPVPEPSTNSFFLATSAALCLLSLARLIKRRRGSFRPLASLPSSPSCGEFCRVGGKTKFLTR